MKLTGCPIRGEMRSVPPCADAAKRLGLDPLLQTLVVTGASQGAATVNDAAVASLATLKLQGWQILHLSGKDHATTVRQGYREAGLSAIVIDFTPAMADVWATAETYHQPSRREQLCRADRLRRAVDSHALPLSQRYAPACQRQSAGRRRRRDSCR